jgi:Sec-independent protein translocase protein TatA
VLAFLQNLSLFEIVVVAVVAVLVFGGRLPEVAGQAASAVSRLKRQLADLRRDTGIDREIQGIRRSVEAGVPRIPRSIDVAGSVKREIRSAIEEAAKPPASEPQPPEAPPPAAKAPESPGAAATESTPPK